MNTTKLLATSAVVMLMATVPSLGQESGQQRERPAPAEKIAPQNAPRTHTQGPNGPVGEAPQSRGRSESTGRAPREERQSRPNEHNAEQERSKTEHPRTEQERRTGQAPRDERLRGRSERDRDQVQRNERANSPSQQNRVEQERERSRTEGNRETTGQGAAATRSQNLTTEKRTRIHEIIVRERNAPRVNRPNFEVSVGTRVPRTVAFVALPPTIVEIEPEWRGFEYFMIGDQMVIVNPRTMEIVAIVDV